jgi:Fe-S-cluster-containing hydrogenase component 2
LVVQSGNAHISAPERFKTGDLDTLVTELAENYRVFVPVEMEDYIEFRLFEPGIKIAWDFQNSTKSPKDIIFPQTEEMFSYTFGKEESDFKIEVPKDDEAKVIIFGIRPCDVHALTKVDHNFKGEFLDNYYLARRENTVLIGLACSDPCYNCFCTSMGGGPHSHECMDTLIIQTPETNIIEIHSESGKIIFNGVSDLMESPPENIEEELSELKKKAEEKIKRSIDIDDLDFELIEMFDEELWEEIAERCIACGICVFLCPTCRCFDIQDEAGTKHGRRIRTWDTCQFPEYTVHASGYNPRPARLHRVRNRILCRLKYTKDKFGVGYCTGCGRCITYCPVNIDIFENFENVLERLKVKKGEKEGNEACADEKSAEVKN